MTREPAQAGDRASRTEHYLQWWENSPEWEAEVSAAEKRHNSGLFLLSSKASRASGFSSLVGLRTCIEISIVGTNRVSLAAIPRRMHRISSDLRS